VIVDRASNIGGPASPDSTERHAMAVADTGFLPPTIFTALLQQNWENVRSIKTQPTLFIVGSLGCIRSLRTT
jgi:hypothetical protein